MFVCMSVHVCVAVAHGHVYSRLHLQLRHIVRFSETDYDYQFRHFITCMYIDRARREEWKLGGGEVELVNLSFTMIHIMHSNFILSE